MEIVQVGQDLVFALAAAPGVRGGDVGANELFDELRGDFRGIDFGHDRESGQRLVGPDLIDLRVG
jgi:hypothetical protein